MVHFGVRGKGKEGRGGEVTFLKKYVSDFS